MDPQELRWQNLHEQFAGEWFERAYPEALATAQSELAAAREAFGPDHPSVIRAFLDVAMASQANQQPQQAQQAQDQAQELSLRMETQTANHPESPVAAAWLIFDADRWWNILGDDEERVLAKYRRALAIREKHFGPEHPETADVLSRLAEIDYLRGRFVDAEPVYRRALSFYEKSGDLERPYYVKTLEGLAQTLKALERYSEAAALFARALKVADEKGKEKRSLYYLLTFYAECLKHLGQDAQAENLLQRAQQLLPQTNPGAFGFQA